MYSILYVDDDENLLGLNKIFMEKTGEFLVDTAVSATEALERIPNARYDAILSDYQMPEMDGIEFLKQVRARHGDIPFILFTGRGREAVVIEAVDNGVDYYIQKGPDLKAMIAELRYKILRAIEHRQIVSDLKKSREELTDIINFLPDATCVIDTGGKVIAWNHAMECMTKIPRQEMIGQGDYAYAVPFFGKRQPILVDYLLHNLPGLAGQYPGYEETGRKINAERFYPSMNGGAGAHLRISASLLYDTNGKVTGGIETIQDLTEVNKIKRDLSISRAMNQEFANLIPVAVYEMDLSGNLTFANRVALSWFGITEEDFEKTICVLDYIVPEDRERTLADIRRLIAGESGTGQEYLLRRKDDSTFPGLIYAGRVRDPETGSVIGLRGIIIDQTRKKQEARLLHESEERLKLALGAGDIAIWDLDMRTQMILGPDEWLCRTLDYPPGKNHGIPVGTVKTMVHSPDIPRIQYMFSRHLADQEPFFSVEFRLLHRDGNPVWVAVRGKVIERDSDGQPLRITGTINTIAEPGLSRQYRPRER